VASKPAIKTAVYVVDTSYLLELFNVPKFSDSSSVNKVREKFDIAMKAESRLYVPMPCIFELADHIADVQIGSKRFQLAGDLVSTVLDSIATSIPWNIVPSRDLPTMKGIFTSYATEYVKQSIGLTDTTVINEANRLKKKYNTSDYGVHIWTKDKRLKSFEPDRENNPFIG
jgi:hypothetical protein